MTSSTKPEVHNITPPVNVAVTAYTAENLVKFGRVVCCRQTDGHTDMLITIFSTPPGVIIILTWKGAEYYNKFVYLWVCVMCVCLSVCPEHISKTHVPLHQIVYALSMTVARSFMWRRYETLCTSGFVDDVMFSRNWLCDASYRQSNSRSNTASIQTKFCSTRQGRSMLHTMPFIDIARARRNSAGVYYGDEVNQCVAMQGETLQEVEGSKRCTYSPADATATDYFLLQ